MEFSIHHTNNPAAAFERMGEQLSGAGAAAFGRDSHEFAPQVRERFETAHMAQILKLGRNVVGFALYDVLRSSVWRCAVPRGAGFAA